MPPNARLSWHIRLTLTCYSHVSPVNIFGSPPFRLRQTVCLSGSEAEGKGLVLVFVSTDPGPLGGHGEIPWQVGASMFCFWLASSSPPSWSSALGSGFPAGWGSGSGRPPGSGFRPAVGFRVGFRVRRFGVIMKPSLGTKNPQQTPKPMMTMSVPEKYLVDRGYRQGQQSAKFPRETCTLGPEP